MTSWTEENRPRTTRTTRQLLGDYGERLAARHLAGLGLVVLDRNWRCSLGEIDLVLRDGHTLVVCKVKTRRSMQFGSPHEALDAVKVDRLKRLGIAWLHAHPGVRPDGLRIDLVAVLRPRRGPSRLEHVPGVL